MKFGWGFYSGLMSLFISFMYFCENEVYPPFSNNNNNNAVTEAILCGAWYQLE